MQIARWGNGSRAPAGRRRARAGLREGDEVEIVALQRDRWAVRPAEVPAALQALRRLRGRVPADFRFDREQAHERA